MPKLVNTDEEVKKIMDAEGVVWGPAISKFRDEFYKDTINIITAPSVDYDTKTDRYVILFALNGARHRVKAADEVANFVLSLAGDLHHTYFGFKLDGKGKVVDAVAEVWK